MLLALLACTPSPAGETGSGDTGAPAEQDTAADSGDTGGTWQSGWIVVSDAAVADAGGDGTWSPGESLYVSATLTNLRDDDYMYYPGILVRASDERVTSPSEGGNWLYGLFGNTSQELAVEVVADAAIPSGTVIDFTVEVTSLGCADQPDTCLDPAPISIQATVQ